MCILGISPEEPNWIKDCLNTEKAWGLVEINKFESNVPSGSNKSLGAEIKLLITIVTTLKKYFQTGVTASSISADDIGTGDGAVTIATSSGNITIDAQAGDADIIFKGTDSSSDITALTLDMSAAGLAVFNDSVTVGDNLNLTTDSTVINFGADSDTTLTHTDGTGLTLNSTNKLCFNDASQFIQGSSATVLSIGATDEIDLTATAVDLNGTLNVSGVATFQSTPVFPDGSIALADLDIDGGTDIGEAIVDADLFIVDNGAGGTNRKVAASRIVTYIDANSSAASVGKAIAMAIVFG